MNVEGSDVKATSESNATKNDILFLILMRFVTPYLHTMNMLAHALHYCKGDECESSDDDEPSTMYT